MNKIDSGKPVAVYVPLGTVPHVVTTNETLLSPSPSPQRSAAAAAAGGGGGESSGKNSSRRVVNPALATYAEETFHLDFSKASLHQMTLTASSFSSSSSQENIPEQQQVIIVPHLKTTQLLPTCAQVDEAEIQNAAASAVTSSASVASFEPHHQEGEAAASGAVSTSGMKKRGVAPPPVPKAIAKLDSLHSIAALTKLVVDQNRRIELLERQIAESEKSLDETGPRTALVSERSRNLLLSAELEDTKERLRASEETVQEFAAVVAKLKSDVRQLVELHSVSDFQSAM